MKLCLLPGTKTCRWFSYTRKQQIKKSSLMLASHSFGSPSHSSLRLLGCAVGTLNYRAARFRPATGEPFSEYDCTGDAQCVR